MEDVKKDPCEDVEQGNEHEEMVEEVIHEEHHDKSKKKKRRERQLEEEIIELKEELAVSKNAYFKAYADTENLKRRLQNEADSARKYRIQSFAQDILSAIDNLERAIMLEPKDEDEDVMNYIEGIKMIYQQIMTSLEKEGVQAIECLNKPFDPNIHQALLTEKVEGVDAGIVVEEIQKGYMLKDRVLRASLVKVSE